MTSSTASLAAGAARGGALNIVGAICQQVCLLLTMVAIARALGEADLGRYTLVYALMMVMLVFSAFGFRAALTRDVARHLADASGGGSVRAVLRIALGSAAALSVILGLLLVVAAEPLAALFREDIAFGLRLVGLTLPALTLRELALAATQGWQTQRDFALIGWIFEPLGRLALTVTVLVAGAGLESVFVVLAVSTWLSATAACVALAHRVRSTADGDRDIDRRSLFSYSLVSWGSTLAFTGITWTDTILLGLLTDAETVGVYTVATRLVSLAVFVMAPINAVFAPQFAHLHHVGERGALLDAYALSTGWILRLSMPAFVLLLVYPKQLLQVFGTEFVDASLVTSILVIGQLVNAASGPCGTLLNMSGHVWVNMTNNFTVLAGNILLNVLLIPHYGIVGAAAAWSICLVLVNLARLLQVRVLLGIHPFSGPSWRAGVSGLAALVCAVAARPVVPLDTIGLLLSLAVVGLPYLIVTLVLRFTQAERDAFAALRP